MKNLLISEISTVGSIITLNFDGYHEGSFDGSAAINAIKTWQLSNDSEAREFSFRFLLSDIYDQNFPESFRVWSNDFNAITHVWTPPEGGLYEIMARKRSDGDWIIKIFGPNR